MVLCLFHVNSLSDPKDLLIPFMGTNKKAGNFRLAGNSTRTMGCGFVALNERIGDFATTFGSAC
jgi:hypothetical protein